MRQIVLVVILLLSVGTVVSARPITFDDLYSIPIPSDPQISPDGRTIAFVLRTTDWESEKYVRNLWLMGADGSNQRRLDSLSENLGSPRWAPDGSKLYFLAAHEDISQVWAYWIDGDSTSVITSLASGVDEFYVGPAGKRIALVTSIEPKEQRESPYDYDHLMYRHYNRWDRGERSEIQLFDYERGGSAPLAASAKSIPSELLAAGNIAISSDDANMAYATSTDSVLAIWPNNRIHVNRKINPFDSFGFPGYWSYYALHCGPLLELDKVSVEQGLYNPGNEIAPSYCPADTMIAFLLQARRGYESDQSDLVVTWPGAPLRRNLTPNFDRSVGGYVWDPSSRAIWFTAIDHGYNKVYRVDIETTDVSTVLDDAVYGDLAISPDGSFLILSRSLAHEPYELYRYDIADKKLSQLTHVTDQYTAELDLSEAQEFWFAGFNGDSVHGWLTLPPAFEVDSVYPLALLIHGGPQWCWLGDFNYYGWNTQLMAAQGYVVAQIDPHGSVGYGLAFKEYVSGNWGRGDYDDLMLGVDYLLDTYDFIDSSRKAALGRSYGGFMTNWICGHTDRFKCLVTIDGSYDMRSHYGTTEELWFPEWEFKGTPWSNPEEYQRASPGTYAANFKTPTMIIHGQKDYRVDLSEGLQMFTALQRQGIPSRLLYFPDEGHSIGKLGNLRYAYDEQLKWLQRWLK